MTIRAGTLHRQRRARASTFDTFPQRNWQTEGSVLDAPTAPRPSAPGANGKPLHRRRRAHRRRQDAASPTSSRERFTARRVMEVVEENPFLSSFYTDRQKFAFQTQIFFLLSRFKQQQELFQQDLFNAVTVSDYLFAKDRIFACLTWTRTSWRSTTGSSRRWARASRKPDLVIYLQARLDVLLHRIKKRGREFERKFDAGYLEELVPRLQRVLLPLQRHAAAGDQHLGHRLREQRGRTCENLLSVIQQDEEGHAALHSAGQQAGLRPPAPMLACGVTSARQRSGRTLESWQPPATRSRDGEGHQPAAARSPSPQEVNREGQGHHPHAEEAEAGRPEDLHGHRLRRHLRAHPRRRRRGRAAGRRLARAWSCRATTPPCRSPWTR